MNDPRPILVAGRAGQLARCLLDEGRGSGFAVVTRGRPEFNLEDSGAAERIMAAVNPRAVINAAAYTAVDQAESEPERAFAINRDGAAHLAAAAARHDIPIIQVSTDYVFDGSKGSPYVEDDVPCPLNIYGRSKLEGELQVHAKNPSALIFRTSSVYSPYGHNFVRTMLRLAETRDTIRVVDDQSAAPTSATDLAKALLAIVKQLVENGNRGGIYHLTGSGAVTWFDFAAAIFSASARRGMRIPKLEPIGAADYPTAARRPMNSALDCSKAERVFGVRLPPWRQSLDTCLDRIAAISQRSA